jgi:hypothetical protein
MCGKNTIWAGNCYSRQQKNYLSGKEEVSDEDCCYAACDIGCQPANHSVP